MILLDKPELSDMLNIPENRVVDYLRYWLWREYLIDTGLYSVLNLEHYRLMSSHFRVNLSHTGIGIRTTSADVELIKSNLIVIKCH